MANYCDTEVTLCGPEDELQKVYDAIKRACGYTEDGQFKDCWLGRPLISEGIYKSEQELYDAAPCTAGSFTYIEYSGGDMMVLYQSDKWAPQLACIVKLCEKLAPNAEITYMGVEPGCGIYISNDPVMVGKYWVDVYDDNLPYPLCDLARDCYSEPEIRSMIAQAFGEREEDMKIASTNELAANAVAAFDENISIHIIEYEDMMAHV